MIKKGNKLYSIFKFKCPHCHEGKFFISDNPYNLKYAGDIHNKCRVCGRKLSMEPGFYYGAMYVAYALGVALFVSIIVAIYVLFPEASSEVYLIAVLSGLILAGPWLYALSKIIWANFFWSYKGTQLTEQEVLKNNKTIVKSQTIKN
jgi:uncharacterized protein (DUF983 family)